MIQLGTRMGEVVENASLGDIKSALEELYDSTDTEHNSISISNESGLVLEIYRYSLILMDAHNKKLINTRVLERSLIGSIENLVSSLDMDDISTVCNVIEALPKKSS